MPPFDPNEQFDRYQVHQWRSSEGRGWAVYDTVTGDVVATFPYSHRRGAYRDAKAEAARRNLAVWREHTEGASDA